MSTKRKLLLGTLGLLVVLFVGAHVFLRWKMPPVPLPEYEEVDVVWLDQNWTQDDWQWFYHASQGGSLELPMPYEWLINFEIGEVPFLIFTEVGRLMDPSYISRFGFLPNPVQSYDPDGISFGWSVAEQYSTLREDANNNAAGVPVGFVLTPDYPDRRFNVGMDGEPREQRLDSLDPTTGIRADMIGFTCAACHTNQINYQGTGIRIDGGAAMTDLGKFKKAVGNAMGLTFALPTRFNRFADNVLPAGYTAEDKKELKFWMNDLIERGLELKGMLEERGIYPTEEGVARLDAIGRIGNYVLGTEISWDNFSISNAPVNFPPLWDTPWFDWVQYNSSFKLPMVRNAGEAMGVFAAVNFGTAKTTTQEFEALEEADSLFASTVNVVNLHEMESLLRGQEPYTGLLSPEWPEDILGAIDRASAARGEDLYVENCQGCHLPPMTDSAAFYDESNWIEDQGRQYLKLHMVNLYAIGTDPRQAENMNARVVQLGALGEMFEDSLANMGGEVTFGVGLPFAIEQVSAKKYEDMGLSDSLRLAFDGYRSRPYIQAPLAYKARPLNGMWASPPFLHNGSVQNIYQLLSRERPCPIPANDPDPESCRDATFWLGTMEYDPKLLGYETGPVKDGFLYDTSKTGNSNKGHNFEGDSLSWTRGLKGVIGRTLSHDERMDLIEFLKALPSVPGGGG